MPPLLSLRIIHIDYYSHPLHLYSSSISFQAARLTSPNPPPLPVIRIFGSTPANQQACLHIHATRPYLLILLPPAPPADVLALVEKVRAALEKALRAAFGDGNAEQTFIADVEPVSRFDMYGFYPQRKLFLKISTYNPQTVTRIAAIISQRGVKFDDDTAFEYLAFESHIPYVMQFLVDYSLAGMDYIHLSAFKFRPPLPSCPAHQTARQLFELPNSQRRFVSGLQDVRHDLFWPFKVQRKSTCPLELDAFPDNILNANMAPDTEFGFVSRTLAVIWQEERLRTGEQVERKQAQRRKVIAGAALTDEFMTERLAQVCVEASEENDTQNQSIKTQSFDDVLRFLDATPSAPTDEIQPFEEPPDEQQPLAEREEEDHESVQRTWADIADCTQHESVADEQKFKERTVKILDEESAASMDTPTLTAPLGSIGKGVTVAASLDAGNHRPGKRKLGEMNGVPIGSFENVPKEEGEGEVRARNESSGEMGAISYMKRQLSSSESKERISPSNADGKIELETALHQVVKPVEQPPAFGDVMQRMGSDDALAIKYDTPFYGDKKDEVKTSEVYGGRIVHVRASGASGYAPFPLFFEEKEETRALEVLPRIICPVERPPLARDLLKAMTNAIGQQAAAQKSIGINIDSAGRQVKNRSQGEQSMSSAEPPYVHLGATQDIADLAKAFNEDENDMSTAQTDKKSEQPHTPPADDLEYRRPMSPKYDEAYQITNIADSGAKSRKSETPKSDAKSASGRFIRNSTMPQTQSAHLHQNISVMSIEVIASCYGTKLPDPSHNQILAVCTALQRDQEGFSKDSISCIVFTVRTPPQTDSVFTVVPFNTESELLDGLARHIRKEDPDIIVGYETQNSSIGYILERSQILSHPFPSACSRWLKGGTFDHNRNDTSNHAAAKYYQRKGADVKITGRHVVSLWRIVRKEVKLTAYSREAIASDLFGMRFPKHQSSQIEQWFCSQNRFPRAIHHLAQQAHLNIAIIDKLDVMGRTGELARVFGIDFMSVLTRGSQYRVESMMRRVTRVRDFALLAAPREEVFRQPAVEALPLVMEPQSAMYVDPVIVLDFQSLYPSVIIGHNLCFSTMLGNVNRISTWGERRRIGVRPGYDPPLLGKLDFTPAEHVFVASNGEMFVDSSIRRGILPILLEEILETRVMVKSAMKRLVGEEATANMLNARQFGLKMIANVTYGYTSASFSGRMPCAGLADAIVQSGRDCLEEVIRYVEEKLRPEAGTTVVYGDTDSLFVQCPGATRDEAFTLGERIVAYVADKFPEPITLKLEKVYQPCVLQTKKRYVGYSYESRKQAIPIFDAKGIETVRRDSCPLVQKALERSIRILFETKNISLVKRQIQQLCRRLHQDRVPFADYIFRKEVRLGTYKEGHLPPAAIVATKAMEKDSRNVPRHGERVSFVVLYEQPGAPLKDCVVSPEEFLECARRGGVRLNTTYYITKQILPALNRIFSLVGVRVGIWYAEMPRPTYEAVSFTREKARLRAKQSNLNMFYASEKCVICHGKGVAQQICRACVSTDGGKQAAYYVVAARLREAERRMVELRRICLGCVNDRNEIGCDNLICMVHDERVNIERRIESLGNVVEDETVWGGS